MTAPRSKHRHNDGGGGASFSAAAALASSSSAAFPPHLLLPTRVGAGRLRSGFSTQVLSVHTTSPSASFGSSEQRPCARAEGGCGGGGGGGASPRPAAFGAQADSTRPSAPSPGFGKGVRRLGADVASFTSPSRPAPPGPGAYAVSAAEAATKRAAPRFVFGQSGRGAGRGACDAEARAMGGGTAGGGNADTPPPGSYTPLGALGGRQPTRPAAPAVRFGAGRSGAAAASSLSSSSGVPGVGLYSDGASAAALGLVSTRRCAPAHSFGARGGFAAGRKAAAAAAGGGGRAAGLSPRSSPGPADSPALAAASARQVLSTQPNAPRAGFGHAPRVGLAAAAERADVPGPGTYDA